MIDQDYMRRAFNGFMECGDFLQGKEIVEQAAEVLLSDDAEAYLQRYFDEYGEDPQFGPTLRVKGQALRDSRRVGINYGFARFFLELYPEPPADAVVAKIAGASEEDVARLVEHHPELIGELQQVFVAATLLEALKADLLSGEYLPDDPRRLEVCSAGLRLADRRLDPFTWAAFAGELANALTLHAQDDRDGALSDAIRLYREALAFYESTGSAELTSNALFSLGNTLGQRASGSENQDVKEGVALLERSLPLRPRGDRPLQWAQSRFAMGRALMNWKGAGRRDKIDEAIAHFEACLEVYRPETSLEEWTSAMGELGTAYFERLQGPRADNFRRAIARYRTVLAEGGSRLSEDDLIRVQVALETAYEALAGETAAPEGGSVEALDLVFDDQSWELAQRIEQRAIISEDWVPQGASLSLWTELITVERYPEAYDMPFLGLLATRRRMVQRQMTNGSLTFEVVSQTDRELVYQWAVVDDFAIEDQVSVVRVVRGGAALHMVHYVARQRPDGTRQSVWLGRLQQARLRDDLPERSAPRRPSASREEVEGRLAVLQEAPAAEPEDPLGFRRSILEGIERSTNPNLWATFLSLAGLYLLRAPKPSGATIEAALGALRRSLEVIALPNQPEQWARIVLNIARAYLRRGEEHRASNLQHALFGFEQAARVFSRQNLEIDVGAAVHGMATVYHLIGAPDEPEPLQHALQLYNQALQFRTADAVPEGWAETMLAVGDACLELSQAGDGEPYLEAAEAAYGKVLEAFAANPRFADVERDAIINLMGRASMRLTQIDREGIPQPRVPDGFYDREVYGRVLYLRPLLTAGTLLLPNRFADPASLTIQFDVEPEMVTIEAALYRVLGEYLSFTGIAGRTEGLGGTRAFLVGGADWQGLVKTVFASADLVMMIPHDSPGVLWEIEYIIGQGALGRTVFVMPPASPTYDVAGLWDAAARMVQPLGLSFPPFSAEGLFFCLGASGTVTETIPFDAVWANTLFTRFRHLLPAQ